MPLAEYDITGSLLDVVEDDGAEEAYVKVEPLTSSGAIVEDGNVRLGSKVYIVPASGALPLTLTEGPWRFTIATSARRAGKETFHPIRVDVPLFADMSWGDILDLVTAPVDITASLIADFTALRDDAEAAAGLADASAQDAEDFAASVVREGNGGVMGLDASGKVQDPKRLSTALDGYNVLNFGSGGTVAPGGDIYAAWNAAGLAASKGAAIASPRVFVPYCDPGFVFSGNPTFYDGVEYQGLGYVKVRATTTRARLFDLTGKTDVTVKGFSVDLYGGNITACGILMGAGCTDCDVEDNRFTNSLVVSRAVTNSVLAGNSITLTLDNTGTSPLVVGDVVPVSGVNADSSGVGAGVFNTSGTNASPGTGLTAATSTTISYPKTNADVAAANRGGWVTKGLVGASVYCISAEDAIRPKIRRNWFTGVRAGLRLYQACVDAEVEGNRFTDWGDRCIFLIGNSSGHTSGAKILDNIIDPPNQKFGDPRQPISAQGVATYWHTDIEVAGNRIKGTVSGGNLVAHHTGKSNNDLMGGIADAISFHHSKRVDIHDNVITDAGEVGITVSNDSWVVNVHDNLIDGTNANPIALDWSTVGGSSSFITSIKVRDNIIRNGGQERGQAATGTAIRAGSGSAIWLSGTTNCTIGGNHCEDDQTVATMLSMAYVKDTTTALQINENALLGGCTKWTNDSSVITAGTISFNVKPVTTTLAADTALKTDNTLINAPSALTRTLERGGEYEFELFLVFTTSSTAGNSPGLQVSHAAMASTTISWWADGSGPTATGAPTTTSSSNRTYLTTVGSVIQFGGSTNAPIRAIIRGKVRNGAATALTYQPTWAQITTNALGTGLLIGSYLKTTRVG